MSATGKCARVVSVSLSFFAVLVMAAGPAHAFNACEYEADEHTLALYHLNEGSGGTAADASPNGNDGTLVGDDVAWTSGLFGSGVQLTMPTSVYQSPGQGSAIQLPDELFNRANFTIEMYLNWDYVAQGPIPGDSFCGYLFGDGENTFARGFIDTSNPYRWYCKLNFGVYTYWGWLEATTPHEYALDADTWMHVAFVRSWDGANTKIAIYVDGELAAENSIATGGIQRGWLTYIGTVYPGNASWGGQVDEIRVSDIARKRFGCLGCGDWGYPQGDVNGDCYVNLVDFAIMADQWLKCTDPADPNCDILN